MDETNKTNGAGAQPLLQVIKGVCSSWEVGSWLSMKNSPPLSRRVWEIVPSANDSKAWG